MRRPANLAPLPIACLLARASGWLSRRLGRGGGTTVPGAVLLELRPGAAAELSRLLRLRSVTVSATNGKTTTARLVDAAASGAGRTTVANTAGSNLLRGVTAALLEADPHADTGVFEVDEAALASVVDQLQPDVVVLMNLFRDQLDRYGELESLVAKWRAMVSALGPETTLALNADDPAVAHLGSERPGTVYFGVDDARLGRDELAHAADSTHCPRCDAALEYTLITIGHLGHWRCPACGLARPTPAVCATGVDLDGLEGFDLRADTPRGPLSARVELPGLHNAYNAVAAITTACVLGIPDPVIVDALSSTDAAFGRGERVRLAGRELLLLLAKNPAGANENVRTVQLHHDRLHLLIFLNDRTADGQDVSWIWDVDYEPLFARAASVTISGDRAHDMGLRFLYGGFPADRMTIEPDTHRAIDRAVEAAPPGATVFVLPTYTAMLDLRADLVKRGVTHDFWEDT